jgi:hypothetical protein
MTVALTHSYLSSTQSVLEQARRVYDLLDHDPAAAHVAADELAEVAVRQDAGGDSYFAFMFSEREATPADSAGEENTEQLLAGVVAELQVANVLMAVGQAAGEGGVSGQRQLLGDAVAELEGTIEAFDRGTSQTGHFGFMPLSAPAEESPDLPTAAEGFRRRAEETLTLVVTGSGAVVSSMVTKLRDLVPESFTEAMGKLGKEVETLPKVGKVLRLGLSKLEKVLNLLSRLFEKDFTASLKSWLQELWTKVSSGQLVPAVLEQAFDVTGARACVEDALKSASLERTRTDRAAQEMTLLQARFQEAITTIQALAKAASLALTVAGVVAVFVPHLGAAMGGITALVYLLIIGVMVLLGMDYTDARLDLRRIDGVRTIANRLSA